MTKVKFILSSISSGLLFWSVNHTSVYENYDLNVFKKLNVFSQTIYLELIYTKLLNLVGNHC